MNRLFALSLAALAAGAFLAADLADAKRLGGGKSLGAQRQSVAPDKPAAPSAAPAAPASGAQGAASTPPGAGPASNPVMPAAPAGAAAAKPAAPAATAAPSGASRWLGPVAGLAAGLGLAALASHLGFSEGLASVLLVVLIAVAAIVVVRMLLRRTSAPAARMPYAGAGAGLGTTPGGYETQVPPSGRIEPVFGGAAATGSGKTLPPGFDATGFAREARKQFLAIQSAHDRHDTAALADVMTPELYREIAREIDASGAARPTEIVEVAAEVIDVATEGLEHWVSVRFTGTAREGGVNEPFDEVWNLVKPVDGKTGWLVAGIRQHANPN